MSEHVIEALPSRNLKDGASRAHDQRAGTAAVPVEHSRAGQDAHGNAVLRPELRAAHEACAASDEARGAVRA